jgi:hypothetical protein
MIVHAEKKNSTIFRISLGQKVTSDWFETCIPNDTHWTCPMGAGNRSETNKLQTLNRDLSWVEITTTWGFESTSVPEGLTCLFRVCNSMNAQARGYSRTRYGGPCVSINGLSARCRRLRDAWSQGHVEERRSRIFLYPRFSNCTNLEKTKTVPSMLLALRRRVSRLRPTPERRSETLEMTIRTNKERSSPYLALSLGLSTYGFYVFIVFSVWTVFSPITRPYFGTIKAIKSHIFIMNTIINRRAIYPPNWNTAGLGTWEYREGY